MKGKLIVLCGTDCSGKGTQAEILVEKLKQEGYDVKSVDFPRYDEKSSAAVQMYLNGDFGSAEEVGPYRASVFYAIDRYAAAKEMKQWLKDGKIIISNRYVSANIGHQGGKIKDKAEREKFIDWVQDFEYGLFDIPKPDLNLFLHVPTDIGFKLMEGRGKAADVKGGDMKKDIHEEDEQHMKDAEEAYIYAADKLDNWERIECVSDSEMLSKDDIAEMVWEKIGNLLN